MKSGFNLDKGGQNPLDRWRRALKSWICLCLFLGSAAPWALARVPAIALMVGDSDAYNCALALDQLNLPEADIRIFTEADTGKKELSWFLERMDLAIVDIMQSQPADWLLTQTDRIRPEAKLYAVRGSSHTQDFLDAGFIMDETVHTYFAYTSAANIANLLRFLAHRDLGMDISWEPPMVPPPNGLYHPDAPRIFPDLAEYVQWYKASGHFKADGLWDLCVIFPTFTIDGKKAAVDALIRAYEKQGINSVTWMREMKGWDKTLDRLIATAPLAQSLGSITGFAFKFSSMLTVDLKRVLKRANVPVLNGQYLFFRDQAEWLASPQGISPTGLAFQFSNPEISGLAEPTVIGVKSPVPDTERAYRYLPVKPHVEILAKRAARWQALKQMPNSQKKIVLLYYNHGAGKQNIGASYLNVFRSIRQIAQNLREQGYAIRGEISEARIKTLLIQSGRNIGSWAPDELDRLLRAGNAAFVEMADYKRWLARTPPEFQEKLQKHWGRPEDSEIMVKEGRFVIPCIDLGNLLLVPQPVRGWSDDPEKLYHSTELYPHHQYLAFYLWLQQEYQPDAMISLGTHGTHEWLPGKQAGLSWKCPPEVLIGEIPNLYPYIVDDVGEGIQAKRRGRGVIIDHAVPPFKAGGLYAEYSRVGALISEYNSASSDRIRSAKLERIEKSVRELGLDKDLAIKELDEAALERVEHYLLALKTEMIPYGLHTFGVSPAGQALKETASAMAQQGDRSADFYQTQLEACGPSETKSLIQGLSAGFVPPGAGNDPLRNPESLPTGKNFYAFDPEKVPSKEAWESGKAAAIQIISEYRAKHEPAYPEQVGVVLWAVETIRDQGINVATALYLMGMRPVWDRRDKVASIEPIPGNQLKRPRIDVLLQMSGLFRDTFPQVALKLDQAVKKAATLTDLENFIRQHSRAAEKALIARGTDPNEAKKLSLIRLFSAPSGAYGTKVEKMTSASGLWEDDEIVAKQGFIKMQSYGYSAEVWGKSLEPTYRQHLKSVDATVHTISSNLYGTMDNDDVFQYLGGLSMAVREVSGRDPEVFISMQRNTGDGHVEPLQTTLGRELRARYLNPEWIRGMKAEGYAGAREMAQFTENMWGWQVTTPKAVDATYWEQSYAVYVEDKYGQEIEAFFNRENPWAYQSMTARMLEAVRKGYWRADERIQKQLAAEYASNVSEKGVACCEHTCNNPLLNQMVVNIISLPGVLSPDQVQQFKLAVEKAGGKPLAEQVTERRETLKSLKQSLSAANAPGKPVHAKKPPQSQKSGGKPGDAPEMVEGFEMEKTDSQDTKTELSSSGVQWFAALFVLLIISLFAAGMGGSKRV